jgi:ATP-binding cassette, subfamily B, bacterial
MAFGAMGGQGRHQILRGATADRSVLQQKLKSGTFPRIINYAALFKWQLLIYLFTVILDSLLVVATPLLLKNLIDNGVEKGNGGLVTKMAFLVILLALLDGGINLFNRSLAAQIGEGLIFQLRSQVFAHVQKQSIAFFTRTQTGALISRLNSDVIGAQQAFTSTLSNVVANLLTLSLVAIAMFSLSWKITIISLAITPLFLIPSKLIGKRLQALTRESFNLNAEMSATMTERFNVSGALLVSLYGNESVESLNFRSKARKVADIGIKSALLNRLFIVSLSTLAAIATAIAYGLGGHFAIEKTISIGTLVAITTLLARLYGPITALSNVRLDVMTALVSFERVFELLDLQPMVRTPENPRPIPGGNVAIKVSDVHFKYPTAQEISLASLEVVARKEIVETGEIIKGISFEVPPASFTAIVGPSGAGKSTISALIPRLYDVTGGSISLNGVDLRQAPLEQIRQLIGVVTQDSHLFHDTIKANLQYAKPGATDEEMFAAADCAQIGKLIRSLPNGLETIVGERGHRLSGGEKQRLAIARLLLKAPAIVILDEATAHLDSENEALVQLALKEALVGRTSIVIAHRLSTIVSADQILVMNHGEIVERGVHEELVARKGLYFDLYQRQNLEN